MDKRFLWAVLVIYVAAVVGAIIIFDQESFDNQLVGWIGGLTFGILARAAFDKFKTRNKKENV